jgi:5-methyltetrahydrofolate--homocysteine methyltransferase
VNHEAKHLLDEALAGRSYLLFDGAMGTMLQKAGMPAGTLPELLNIQNPAMVTAVHRAYVAAGSQVVTANTFGANRAKLGGAASVEDVYKAAAACARAANPLLVAANMGPTGSLLKPLGTMDFDEAYELYAEQARAAVAAGMDLVIVETMSDILELKAAVLAVRENSDLPLVTSMTFGEDGCTFLGTSPEVAAATLTALGVDALGVNCSLGPNALLPLVRRMEPYAGVPLIVEANAGLPRVVDGVTTYDVSPDEYAEAARGLVEAGVTILGGCCGTTPAYIERVVGLVAGKTPTRTIPELPFCVTSPSRIVALPAGSHHIAVVGERINPTGKKRLKEALRSGDLDYVLGEAIDQKELGADVLDVNVGLPELDECAVLTQVCEAVQSVCDLPLQLDSTDVAAVERAARRYAGKPLVNSVNGKAESLATVLPVVAKYGCAVVALTLDERGIPERGDERFEIARRIVEAAEALGIPRSDVVVDCLCMAASTNQDQVRETLHAIRRVRAELGVKTTLGVSNISFGLPQRELVNAVFLSEAFGAGLDLPILNVKSARVRDVVAAARVLSGQDRGAAGFIEEYAGVANPYEAAAAGAQGAAGQGAVQGATGGAAGSDAAQGAGADGLLAQVRHLVLTGRKGPMREATERLLASRTPLEVIDGCFIPALDEVGARFEKGELFLPQLMASAEAVKAGFDAVRAAAPAAAGASKGSIVLATVKGDIHDIGKNIVKMLLENYGYRVYDLGRDVDPQLVLDAVRAHGVQLVGLSALMTTTVRAMEETIALLRREAPDVRVMVGGAVLTPEYARMVGADWYAKDAAESARIAGEFFAQEG